MPDKICRENHDTNFMFSNFFFLEYRAVCEIMLEKYGRAGQATTRRMRFACCVTKVTEAPSECGLFTVFARHQRLRERAVMLRCTYIACHVLQNSKSCTGFWTGFLPSVCSVWPRPVPLGYLLVGSLSVDSHGAFIVDEVSAGSRGGYFIMCVCVCVIYITHTHTHTHINS